MPEENQIAGGQQINSQGSSVSSLRAETERFQKVKESLKRMTDFEINLKRSQETEKLYEKSLTSSNQSMCSQYDRACKSSEMARGLRKYGESMGYDWSNIDDIPLLNQYSSLFPESGKIMYDYVTHSDEDNPMPYYIKLGWEKETDEDVAESYFKKAWNNFTWSFEKAGQGLRTMWNAANMYDRRGEYGAIQDYVYNKYGANATDEEWKEAQRDLRIDPSLLDKYANRNTGVKDAAMGGVVTAMDVNPIGLGINLGTSAVAATNPGEKVFGTIGQGAETVGYYANKFPGLKQYRDSLATEEDKRERDQFVGQEIFALITRGAVKGYKEIKTMSNDGTWGGGIFKKFQEQRMDNLNKKLQETGGKIAGAKTVQEQETATRGLQDADIKGSKNYETLTERLQKRGKEIEAQEDIEYSKNEKKFKPEETRSLKTFEKDGYKSSVLLKPVEEGIELLKDFYEGSPEKTAQLDLIEQKFKNEGLTKGEINNIARAIADEYSTYKKRGEPKTSLAAKDVEGIRKAVKEFAREGNDKLVELDKKWSDNLNTRQMISDIQDAIVKFNMNKRSKNLFQNLSGVAANLFAYFGGREFLGKIFKNAVGDENYTPVLRQSDLKKLTNKFTKLNEKLNGAKNKVEVERIVAEFNNEMNEEFGPIEGEVIEKAKSEGYKDGNSYLEDKIEIKEDVNH